MNYNTAKNVSGRSVFFSSFTEPRMGMVYDAIANGKPMNFDSPLNMDLDMSPGLTQNEPLDADTQTWSSDMTLGGGTSPLGNHAIISEKIWDIIKDLRLPPNYNLVPIRLMFNSKVRQYFLFHTYHGKNDEYIDFDNCIYEERFRDRLKRETKVIKRFRGGFKSTEEEQYVQYSEDKMTVVYRVPVITALKENWDLFWSNNGLRMNSKARDLFEKHKDSIHGVSVMHTKGRPTYYVCPEDYHILDQNLDDLLDNLH